MSGTDVALRIFHVMLTTWQRKFGLSFSAIHSFSCESDLRKLDFIRTHWQPSLIFKDVGTLGFAQASFDTAMEGGWGQGVVWSRHRPVEAGPADPVRTSLDRSGPGLDLFGPSVDLVHAGPDPVGAKRGVDPDQSGPSRVVSRPVRARSGLGPDPARTRPGPFRSVGSPSGHDGQQFAADCTRRRHLHSRFLVQVDFFMQFVSEIQQGLHCREPGLEWNFGIWALACSGLRLHFRLAPLVGEVGLATRKRFFVLTSSAQQ
jgi:hypothetical protein